MIYKLLKRTVGVGNKRRDYWEAYHWQHIQDSNDPKYYARYVIWNTHSDTANQENCSSPDTGSDIPI